MKKNNPDPTHSVEEEKKTTTFLRAQKMREAPRTIVAPGLIAVGADRRLLFHLFGWGQELFE